MDAIDKSKENIQPLRQGRNTEQLCEALSDARHRKHVSQMQYHEMRLRTYEGDDPLEPWHTYILWLEQTSTGRDKKHKDILKQCLKRFSTGKAYNNDIRFIDLWFKYLSTQANRMELYETVLGHGIGVNSSNFYQRWAADLEAAGDFRGADKVYQRGLSEELDCRASLENALQRFQMRAAKAIPEENFDMGGPQRAVLGRLESRDGRVPVERAQFRPLGANRPMEKPIKEQAAFPVFIGGENEKPRRQLMKELPDERARVENEAAPCKWTEAASGRELRPLTATPFKVLEDPAIVTPRTQQTLSKRVLQEVKPSKQEPEFPLAYFEPANDKCKPMYCKDKVYCGGTEFSFEELRADSWKKRKVTCPVPEEAKDVPTSKTRKEILMYETVRDGQEWSFEELRAQDYLAKLKKKFEYPVAHFEPDNPNQVRMYDKERVYADGTEYSPEELRAKDWVARSQSALLCQSMTVHTREALAAVQDLWHSRRETPPTSPPNSEFKIYQDDAKEAPAFEIFCDEPKPSLSKFAVFSDEAEPVPVKFEIFSDEPKAAPVKFEIFSDEQNPVFAQASVTNYKEECKEQRTVLLGSGVSSAATAPYGKFIDDQENVFLSQPNTFGSVLQPRSDILTENLPQNAEEEEEEEEGDDEEKFEVKPLPPLPELPYVAPPEHWEPNGPEDKENLSPSRKLQSEFYAEDEDTQFIMGPLGVGSVNSLEDVTVGLMKRPAPTNSSTPYGHQPQSLITMQPHETRNTMLSPILEMTGESRGSRSGSSSSGVSSVSSLKTPGQSLGYEATHHTVAPVRLELLEEEEEVSEHKEQTGVNIFDDPWSLDLQMQLVPCVEGVQYIEGTIPVARVNSDYHIGKKSFKLKKILGEGAYGKIYKAEEPIVIKLLQEVTPWELYISRKLRSRVPSQLVDYFCEVSAATLYSNGTVLEMPLKSELTLLNVINLKPDMRDSTKAFLVHQLLVITEALHNAKIIHADIKPDNFLLLPSRNGDSFKYHLQLIDFGRCIDLNILPSESRFTAILKAPDARCVAMRQQRPWSYDLDYYSTAATVHVILFGKYLTLIEVKSTWKPTSKPKRFWHLRTTYERLFEEMINPIEGKRLQLSEFLDPLFEYAEKDMCVVNEDLESLLSSLP